MNRKENEPISSRLTYHLDNTVAAYNLSCSPISPTVSVFDDNGKSSSSSPLSSPEKFEFRWTGEEHVKTESKKVVAFNNGVVELTQSRFACPQPKSQPQRTSIQIQQLVNEESCPLQQQSMNPRRTQSSSLAQSSVVCQTSSRCPPQLTRQCDRTQNFVENLVDTSTQMIEVIWPLSISHCDKDYLGGKNLIGLRTFIQEVLKRSKTSYYTLQVALYYLVLIKPCVPKVDFTQQQTEITHAQRAMQCGRRMFLAALILASKYLQDRNYSARAWSKISGLKISEINSNEMAFVTAVNWKLHIPEPKFQRWANIVFKYSTSQSATNSLSPGSGRVPEKMSWRQVVLRLTPDLDEVDIERFAKLSLVSAPSCSPLPIHGAWSSSYSIDADKTPTPASVQLAAPGAGNPPFSPRISALPTPVMTPHMQGYHAPAARTWCQGQAMRETMQQIQCEAFGNISCESWPKKENMLPIKPLARVFSNGSMISSPESMVSDISTNSCSSRTSRSSSICSVASSSIGALGAITNRTTANHRSTLASLNGSCYVPACIGRPEPYVVPTEHYSDNAEMDATLALMNLARTHKLSSNQEPGQKRARPLSIVENNISEEVRALLSESYAANQTDSADLTDNRQARSFALSQPNLVKNLVFNKLHTSTGSQAGARKKPRSSTSGNSWIAPSPRIVCLR